MTKSYTEKYGQPQGNELVYGKDIIRQVDAFEFILIDRFETNKAALIAYNEWMDENDPIPSVGGWKYIKPIVGWDNGPITIDSWGKKIND